MTCSELSLMQNTRLDECDLNGLAELRNVNIDRTRPIRERMEEFLKAVGNPYLFKVGDVTVKVSFDPRGKTLADALACVLLPS